MDQNVFLALAFQQRDHLDGMKELKIWKMSKPMMIEIGLLGPVDAQLQDLQVLEDVEVHNRFFNVNIVETLTKEDI